MTGAGAGIGLWAMVMGLTVACGDGECFLDAGLPCSICESVTEPARLGVGGGTPQAGFVEMQDGDEMTVVLGPSGPYMVTPSIRAWGVFPGEAGRAGDPADPTIAIEALLETEQIGSSWPEHLGLTVTVDGAERLGIFVPFWEVDLGTYLDQLVTIRGEITDVCGNTATDTLDVVLVQ